MPSVSSHRPELQLDGVLVEAMGPRGLELVVGAKRDADWGPVVLVGLGGVWIEALKDVRLIPADMAEADIVVELGRLKAASLLKGIRGAAAVDVQAVARVVALVGAQMRANPQIAEIDINPLVAYPDRVLALDALVVVKHRGAVMKLQFSAADEAFRQEVRAFVAANLPADIKRKVELGLRLEHEDYVTWFRILESRGWITPGWPVEHGGPGWNHVQRYIFDEETLLGGAPRIIASGIQMLGPVLIAFGTEAQKKRYLPDIRHSNTWWAQGFSEPGAGSDLAAVRTTAVKGTDADGEHFIVNGHKVWTSYAQWCSMMFALVRTDPAAQAAGGHLLPADRHEVAGCRAAPDPHARRRHRPQRGLPRQRARAGREPGRRAEQGLVLRQVPARPRAHRHRRHRLVQAAARAGAHAGGSSRAWATTRCCSRAWRSSRSS